jgi:hypothetical protein
MEGLRDCDQCGSAFEPRREHARFCTAACRIAWHRDNSGTPWPGETALSWSAAAMGDAARRLADGRDLDLPQALAVISETVWWVTMVDATVVRYHHADYDRTLAGLSPAERRTAEGTLGGLRFVRNWMGYHADPADFIRPPEATAGDQPAAQWTWEPIPAPAAGPAPTTRQWEMNRYRDYRTCLAGHTTGHTIATSITFLARLPAIGDHTGKIALLPHDE